MAIKYENKDDIRREILSRKAEDDRSSQSGMLSSALGTFAIGSLSLTVDRLLRSKAESIGAKLDFSDKFYRYLGFAALATGAAGFITSFFAGSRAKKSEDELEKLGPQHIILPSDIKAGDQVPMSKGKYVVRIEKEKEAQAAKENAI